MTHTSQLSPKSSDYFSHKPRSFLSLHTDFDEKLNTSPGTPDHNRGRRPARLVGYEQPNNGVPNAGPRVPRSRTLIRLLLLAAMLGLVSLGWRCEAVGCKGRGGGALVGDWQGAQSYVGGGSMVAGWGTPEGMDLSKIWDRPSWGGERQGGEKGVGSSTLDAFEESGSGDEERELVGLVGVGEDRVVEWDDEDKAFGDGESTLEGEDAVKADDKEQLQEQEQGVVLQDGETREGQQSEVEYEIYESPLAEDIAGPVGEMTGPVEDVAEAVAVDAVEQQAAVAEAQSVAPQDDHQVSESASLAQKGSWLGSMDGLW